MTKITIALLSPHHIPGADPILYATDQLTGELLKFETEKEARWYAKNVLGIKGKGTRKRIQYEPIMENTAPRRTTGPVTGRRKNTHVWNPKW